MNLSQIVRNAGSNYVRMSFTIVSSLLLTPLIINKLGAEAFGLWTIAQSISAYFSLLDMGVSQAAVRYVSQYRATGDFESLNKLIRTSQSCYVTVSLVAMLVAMVAIPFADRWFKISTTQEIAPLIISVALSFAIGCLGVLPIQCVIASQRQDLLNYYFLIVDVVRIILTIAALFCGRGLIYLALLMVATSLAYCLIGVVLARKLLPEAKIKLGWDQEQAKLLVPFAACGFVTSISVQVIASTDSVIIGAMLSVAAVTGYAVAYKLASLVRNLAGTGLAVLGTFASEQSTLGRTDSLQRMWVFGTQAALTVMITPCAACVLIPDTLIKTWIGETFAGAPESLALLAIFTFLQMLQMTAEQILLNSGYHRAVATISAIEAPINLALSVVLIKIMGIPGVALGTLIAAIPRAFIVYPYYMKKLTGLSILSFTYDAVFKSFFANIIPIAFILVFKLTCPNAGIVHLAVLGVLCAAALAATSYPMLGVTVRQRIRARASGIWEKVAVRKLSTSEVD